jgi:hypothetical protein
MRAFCAVLMLVVAVAPVGADDKDDAAAAAKKTSELTNYSFKGETTIELPAMWAAAMGGADPQKFEGRYDKDAGTTVRTSSHDFVTIGDKTVSCPIQRWDKVQDEDMMSASKRMMGMMGSSRPVSAPHADLAKFAAKLKKAKKVDAKETIGETDCTRFDVELTDGAAEDLVKELMPSMAGMLGQMEADLSAKAKFWVNGDGVIVKCELVGMLAGSLQGMDMEMSATRTSTLYDVGSTKVEVPEGAKKALEK